MKGQNFASQVLSRHTFRISRKKGSDFFDHRGTLSEKCFAHTPLGSGFRSCDLSGGQVVFADFIALF